MTVQKHKTCVNACLQEITVVDPTPNATHSRVSTSSYFMHSNGLSNPFCEEVTVENIHLLGSFTQNFALYSRFAWIRFNIVIISFDLRKMFTKNFLQNNNVDKFSLHLRIIY